MMRSKRFYSKLPIPKLSSLIRIFRDGEQLLLGGLTRWLRRKSDTEEGGTDADAGWKRLLLGRVPEINPSVMPFAPTSTSEARSARYLLAPKFGVGILWCSKPVILGVPPHLRVLGIVRITGDPVRNGHPRRTKQVA